MGKRTDLMIPYGIADFRRIRSEGYYYEELAATGEISFDLVTSFPADAIIRTENFRSLFHYYGVLSMSERKKGMSYFRIPNACVEKQLFNYLRDSYRRVRLEEIPLQGEDHDTI